MARTRASAPRSVGVGSDALCDGLVTLAEGSPPTRDEIVLARRAGRVARCDFRELSKNYEHSQKITSVLEKLRALSKKYRKLSKNYEHSRKNIECSRKITSVLEKISSALENFSRVLVIF